MRGRLSRGKVASCLREHAFATPFRVPEAAGMAIRVVLGEDSFLAREAIEGVLERVEGLELVAACSDLDSLRAAIDEKLPDLVVTDIRMPPDNSDEGIRLAAELRSKHPEIGVVVLSQHAEP